MLDGMAALIMPQAGLIAAETQALVAIFAVVGRMRRRTIIGVDDMASRTAAAAIITGMIIGAHETEQWIVQPHFLQVQNDGISADDRAETAFGEAARGFARRLGGSRDTKLSRRLGAFLEASKNV